MNEEIVRLENAILDMARAISERGEVNKLDIAHIMLAAMKYFRATGPKPINAKSVICLEADEVLVRNINKIMEAEVAK